MEGIIETQSDCTLVSGENVEGSFIPIFTSKDDRISALSDGDAVSLRGGVLTAPPESAIAPEGCAKTGFQYWLVATND